MKTIDELRGLKLSLVKALGALEVKIVEEQNRSNNQIETTGRNRLFYTPEEIASIIMVDVSTVRRWCRNGELKYTKFGKLMRISEHDWREHCRKNKIC